jgi:hypothetical protein
MLTFLAEDMQRLVEQFYPRPDYLSRGWVVFTGAKASGPKAFPGQTVSDQTSVTIAWPLLLPEDLAWMATQPDTQAQRWQLLQQRLVRLIEEGWQHPQGPVLLTQADLALLLGLTTLEVSAALPPARQATGKPLLTIGSFFDQGMRPTHKAEIIALYEQGLDEADIARRTNHAPTRVGRHLRGYERVKELVKRNLSLPNIARLLGLQLSVATAYFELLQQHRPDLVANFTSTLIRT